MTEAEIDSLMAGQEDENGCVNYEGERKRTLLWKIINYYIYVIEQSVVYVVFNVFNN